MSKVRKLILQDSQEKANRRFVISDIHGCSRTFKTLLRQIALKQEDYLFILGDAVNRGPDSAGVLDEIIGLKKAGFQLFYLRGNHEEMILNSMEKNPHKKEKLIRNSNAGGLFDERIIKEKYHNLLNETYHYIELEDYFLVHAGFDFESDEPFENARSMLFINKFKADKEKLKGKKVIIGHNPMKLSKILRRIKKDKRKICIDNGCVNHKIEGQGNLICINLDSRGISIQKNLDLESKNKSNKKASQKEAI